MFIGEGALNYCAFNVKLSNQSTREGNKEKINLPTTEERYG